MDTVLKKTCTKCHEEKEVFNFDIHKTGKFGTTSKCKKCRAIYYAEYHQKNKLKRKKYYALHRNKEYSKRYYQNNKKKMIEASNRWAIKERKINPKFKIMCNLRNRIKDAITRNSKSATTKQLLGCSVEELKNYLQSKFQEGMNWENYGLFGWHIDHIMPCASFDLSKPEEQQKCFHYSNLQPLWAKDNLSKGDKILEKPI